MALAQHASIDVRFQQQYDNSRTYLIPFIEHVMPLANGMQVLEIGCGEGGVLKAFTDRGITCLGVDLNEARIQHAHRLMRAEIDAGLASFITQNVYDQAFAQRYREAFDLILLKDTIEHIPEQQRFIPYLRQFLRPSGRIFFGFPPWYMPFGGHQQICQNKLLSFLPYYHLLPRPVYRALLRAGREAPRTIQELMEIKDTGISIERFERILRAANLQVDRRTLFLINPIYRYKFGIHVRKQAAFITAIPGLRNIFSTAAWYLVRAH